MRSIVIPLLIGLRSSFRSQAELQVEIVALHQQLAVLQRRLSTRPRLPNASQNNYCPMCQSDQVPQKKADQRRRRRMREARVLHDQGVPLGQIAQRLNTKPDNVARWLKTRVRKRRTYTKDPRLKLKQK